MTHIQLTAAHTTLPGPFSDIEVSYFYLAFTLRLTT
jgi:hypothetical protein